mmetsp:Transcript_40703/g.47330  ORF Transcript_40703/g.47330 Transcript_40703/m.47330 type:complete len:174 (+) Transcript_40703:53-574(+)
MSFKLCYSGEIHRTTKTITSYKELRETFIGAYRGRLPISFTMQYKDEDGDSVTLTDEKDFKAMMSSNKKGKTISVHIKEEDNEYEIIDKDSIPEEYKAQAREEMIYNKDVEEKARRLKELIPDNDIDVYLHYVSLDPDKTIEELMDDYLSKYAKNSTNTKKVAAGGSKKGWLF